MKERKGMEGKMTRKNKRNDMKQNVLKNNYKQI